MKTAVIVPNWNGQDFLTDCIDSLLIQTKEADVIVVDNGSTDDSLSIIEGYGKKVTLLRNDINRGFTGGVNRGIHYALDSGYEAVALFNNDAVADEKWLSGLVGAMSGDTGIVTGCFQSIDKRTIDSTGDQLTIWGLPYPRGRGQSTKDHSFNSPSRIFGASGGASLYSSQMLRDVGYFDDDFFAYYEDVDISFRAQLSGWKVSYEPSAIAYHHIGGTSAKLGDFTVYHTFKNLPLVITKNMPRRLLATVLPRFVFAYLTFLTSAIVRGQGFAALRGLIKFFILFPKKLRERREIQRHKKVDDAYILSMLTKDLPENSHRLRKLRKMWWKLRRKI